MLFIFWSNFKFLLLPNEDVLSLSSQSSSTESCIINVFGCRLNQKSHGHHHSHNKLKEKENEKEIENESSSNTASSTSSSSRLILSPSPPSLSISNSSNEATPTMTAAMTSTPFAPNTYSIHSPGEVPSVDFTSRYRCLVNATT
eukprot:jgi/Orpsp1_1/1178676/evm.model.c7180000066304.2